MKIPLAFGTYNEGRSTAANATVMENMMIELDTSGGAANYYIVGTPGCSEVHATGYFGDARGAKRFDNKILCVIRKRVILIDVSDTSAITQKVLGQISTKTGAVQIAVGPTYCLITDGTRGYTYKREDDAFQRVMDADFPTPKACTWKDGYFVVIEDSTGKFFVSEINDPTQWSALSFTTAEYEPDNLVSCIAGSDSLIAFGEDTVQVYYNSGNSDFPFDSRIGANLQVGCGATHSPAATHNTVFWIDDTGIVMAMAGYTPVPISNRHIEYQITSMTDFTEARGYTYSQDGHTFYVLEFPTDGKTLVYDITTKHWHNRTSYQTSSRWRGSWIVENKGVVYTGDYQNGKIYKLDTTVYQDNGNDIRWFASTQNVNSDRHMIQHNKLELHIESGVGLYDGQGDDPVIWMQYSDDDGNTWSHEKWGKMGKIGQFYRRVRFYNLGISRSRIYRVGGTDPVKRVIVSAHIEGEDLGY